MQSDRVRGDAGARTTTRVALATVAFICAAIGLPAQAKSEARAPSTVTMPSCSWDRPGHDPFTGDVVAAVDRYRDMAPELRERLKARMARRDYDDVVSIRRDSITGKGRYGSTIQDMHFGSRRVCHSVTRASWTPSMEERGLVYCEGGQCILVPTVCRNVSRITRAQVSPEHAEGPPEEPGGIGDAGTGDAAPPLLATPSEPTFASPAEMKGPLHAGGPLGTGTGEPGVPGAPPAPGAWESPAFAPLGAPPIAAGDSFVPPSFVDAPLVAMPVPEPQTWALMLSGLAALGGLRLRVRSRQDR